MDTVLPISLFFHFIGLGLFMTTATSGMILEFRLAKAPTIDQKIQISTIGRSIGLLSPLATVLMIVSGIMNMNGVGAGVLTLGWLTAKIFFFALLLISGMLFMVRSRKRTALLHEMASGAPPGETESRLKRENSQVRLFHIVVLLLLFIIMALSVYGVHGGGMELSQ